MLLELIILLVLIVGIAILGYYLWDCQQNNGKTTKASAASAVIATRARKNPAHEAYQNFLRSVSLPDYEYNMYEVYSPKSKYTPPTREAYTLADYNKVQNCSCKNMASCMHNSTTRGWSPSTDTI